jgi:hypothetical protein
MLYCDREIVISDSIDSDVEELYDFMMKYEIRLSLFNQSYDDMDEPISEPFISYKSTVYRQKTLGDLTYVDSRKLLEIVGKKNESKEEQGYPRTKLLLIYGR